MITLPAIMTAGDSNNRSGYLNIERECHIFAPSIPWSFVMAYKIISAIGKVIDSQARWEAVDLNKFALNQLYLRYSTIRATLENLYTKKKGMVEVDDYEYLVEKGKPFQHYLDSLGDKAIPFKTGSTVIKEKGLLYHEAHSARFKIYPVKTNRLPDDDLSLKYDYSDLFLTKEGVNPIDMYNHTLISVNGFIHASDANSKGLWVTDGYKTIRKRKKHCIGIISFEQLGKLEQIPIKEDMISKLNEEVDLFQECVIDIPNNKPINNKTIILVIGGFMHVLDYDVFTRISEQGIKLKLKNTPLLERIHLSCDDLELGDAIFDKRYGDKNLHLANIYSDEFIKKYLTLSYSFIVLLNNEEIFKEVTYPQQRGIPNNYLMDKQPKLPMMTRLGKIEEYVSIKDVDKYVLETADCQYRPRLYNLRWHSMDKDSYYNDARRPTDRYRIPHAFFFNLKTLI